MEQVHIQLHTHNYVPEYENMKKEHTETREKKSVEFHWFEGILFHLSGSSNKYLRRIIIARSGSDKTLSNLWIDNSFLFTLSRISLSVKESRFEVEEKKRRFLVENTLKAHRLFEINLLYANIRESIHKEGNYYNKQLIKGRMI